MSYVAKRSNGRWQARWKQPDGSWRSQMFDTKRDASRFLANIEADLTRGVYRDPAAGQVLVADYAKQWMDGQVWREGTYTTNESRYRNHIEPRFGARQIASIRPSEVQAWVKWLAAGDDTTEPARPPLAATSIEVVYRLLGSIMRAAVADRIIPSTPCVKISLPKREKGKIEPLPLEAVELLRSRLPDHLQVTVTIGAGAGLRLGEILGLTVDRVDFLRRMVTVDRQMVLPSRGGPRFGPPKTPASIRTVPLPQTVVDAIARHLEQYGEGDDRLIVHRPDGRPWRRTRFHEHWEKAREETPWPEALFHDLRHHCASLLISAGCSVKVVQDQLGHASASETLDTYSHLWPEDNDRVRRAVDAAFSRPVRAPSAPGLV